MPSVKLSPLFNEATDASSAGAPLAGGLLYWYLAGTTTLASTYQESTGSTPHTSPIILNSRGEPPAPIWLQTGQDYKAVLTDSLGNIIRTVDNISGINDTSAPVISEWVLFSGSATYIDAAHFSVTGDATATFDANRRIKATVSGGDCYATINTSSYGAGITTVTVVNDSVVLDSGLNSVYYGFLDPAHPSFDSSGINAATKSAFQNQTFTAFTTGGTSSAFTLTPTPAITSLVAGQRFRVLFNAAGTGTPTLSVSGLAATQIKQYNSRGSKEAPQISLNQLADVEYDGTNFVILNPTSEMPVGSLISHAGSSAPAGFLACPTVATNISRTTYADLFAAIGTLWGAGDGSTTFGMPWFPADYAPVQGGTVGSATVGAVIAHTHTISGSNTAGGGLYNLMSDGATVQSLHSDNTGSAGGSANLAAGHRVLFCVKY